LADFYRIIVPGLCFLFYLPNLFEDNFTFRALPVYISAQCLQFAVVATPCMNYMLPLFRSLQSGLLWPRPSGDASPFPNVGLNGFELDAKMST
jgi:hypothetical protein